MKNNVLKYYITAAYLFSTLVMFAQPGDGNGQTGDGSLEGADAPAPIDDYVWILVLIGLLFVFLKLRTFSKQGNK